MKRKKLTIEQVVALKMEASLPKNKNRDTTKCFVCGKKLPADRRWFCPDCV